MPSERFLVVTDTPGIKQFVFGTDALSEVRGASALLDRLNRHRTEPALRDNLPAGATCKTVFANGGTGQFIVDARGRIKQDKDGVKKEMDPFKEELKPEQIDSLIGYIRSLSK